MVNMIGHQLANCHWSYLGSYSPTNTGKQRLCLSWFHFKGCLPGPWERHPWVLEDLQLKRAEKWFIIAREFFFFFFKVNALRKERSWAYSQDEICLKFSLAEGNVKASFISLLFQFLGNITSEQKESQNQFMFLFSVRSTWYEWVGAKNYMMIAKSPLKKENIVCLCGFQLHPLSFALKIESCLVIWKRYLGSRRYLH